MNKAIHSIWLLWLAGAALAAPISHPGQFSTAAAGLAGFVNSTAGEQPATRYSPADDQGRYRFMVRFDAPGALERYRVLRGQAAGFHLNEPVSRSLLDEVAFELELAVDQAARMLGRALEPSHYFMASYSGLAVHLTLDEAARLRDLPGVVAVERERIEKTQTHRGAEFIGAGAIWNGMAVPGGDALRGEGMVIAIIDSGVFPADQHDSLANDPACGHGQGGTPDKLLSMLDCASATGPGGLCDGDLPLDVNGHGAHVAATAAGNLLDETTAFPPLDVPGDFDSITGVAPCAHVRSYKACPGNFCPGADVTAALQSTLLHGDVDVMNFSIGGGRNPWNDNDRVKLDLVDAGIFVAAAAGNRSPDLLIVEHRGPWVTAVGNSTHDVGISGQPIQGDRMRSSSLTGPVPPPFEHIQKPDITAPGSNIFAADTAYLMSVAGPGEPPPETQLRPLQPGSSTRLRTPPATGRVLRRDGDQEILLDGCFGFPENFFADGAAAFVRRGGCEALVKIQHAYEAGADFIIIYDSPPHTGGTLNTRGQPGGIEAFQLSHESAQPIWDWMLAHDNEIQFDYIVGTTYDFKTGTSMSSPHVAGAAALVGQARPDWSPMEIQSALRMTAERTGFKADGITPWDADDVGSGRVELTGAALAGLVMDETYANFLAADPSSGGDTRTLNLAALRDADCDPDCTFTRTLRNTLNTPATWSATGTSDDESLVIDVSPDSFSFAGDPDEIVTLTVTVTPSPETNDLDIGYGFVELIEDGQQSPDLHWSVAAARDSCDILITPEGSINGAIASAPVSATICLTDGVYEEAVEIDLPGLTLAAAPGISPILDGANLPGQNSGILINGASGVTIEGLTIRNFEHFGVRVNTNSPNAAILNNIIEDNGIINPVDSGGIGTGGPGLLIHGNLLRNNLQSGIVGGRDATISDNVFEGGVRGIYVTGSFNNLVATGNTFRTDSVGIFTWPGPSPSTIGGGVIANNVFENIDGFAMLVRAEDTLFHDNVFSGNDQDLVFRSALDLTVTDNEFEHRLNLLRPPGEEIETYLHEISGNTVGGRPLVYLRDVSAPAIDSEAGQIILVNVSDVEISGFERDEFVDVLIAHSEDVMVIGNNGVDVYVRSSTDVTVHDNIFENLPEQSVLEERFRGFDNLVISENIFIEAESHGLSLSSAENPVSVIDNQFIDSGNHGIRLGFGLFNTEMNALISGNLIEGSAGSGIHLIRADGVQVIGNTLSGNGDHAISISGCVDTLVQANQIQIGAGGAIRVQDEAVDVQLDGNVVSGAAASSFNCIHVESDTQGQVLVTSNTVVDCGNTAIAVRAAGALVAGNVVAGSSSHGIEVRDSSAIEVRDNEASQNGRIIAGMRFGSGIQVFNVPLAVVENNVSSNNVHSGITVRRSSNQTSLLGNDIQGNGLFGLELMGDQGMADVQVEDNQVVTNPTGIYVEAEVSGAILRNNEIEGNGAGVVSEQDLVDARENWWGEPSGPGGGVADPVTGAMAQGSGDTVSENVRFDPWIGEQMPQVHAVDPDSGPNIGGTPVSISGQEFAGGAEVRFGGNLCHDIVVVSGQSIQCITPANAVTVVDVSVTNPTGLSAVLEDGFTYTATPPPVITSIEPDSGPMSGGTELQITGDNFSAQATVAIGKTGCALVEVSVPDFLTCTTLEVFEPGSRDVTVSNPDGNSTTVPDGFTYLPDAAPAPQLFWIDPDFGPTSGGTLVVLEGDAFQPGATVMIGDQLCADLQWVSAFVLACEVPPGEPGDVDVEVANPDGQTVTLADAFSYVTVDGDGPVLDQVIPALVPDSGGVELLIQGDHFSFATRVRLGITPCLDHELIDQHTLACFTPALPPGVLDVRVSNGDGQFAVLRDALTVFPTADQIFRDNFALQPSVPVLIARQAFDALDPVRYLAVDVRDGEPLWSTPSGLPLFLKGVVTDPQGYSYWALGDGRALKLDPDGDPVWIFDDYDDTNESIAVDADGSVYVSYINGFVRKLDAHGNEVFDDHWPFEYGSNWAWSIALDSHGRLFLAGHDGVVRRLEPDGSEYTGDHWPFEGHEGPVVDVAVDSQGRIYTASWDGTVRGISPQGESEWVFGGHDGLVRAVAVSADGRVYSGSGEPAVRVTDSDGNEITDGGWPRLDFPGQADQVYSLVVDPSGRVLVGTDSSHVIALTEQGQVLWRRFFYQFSRVEDLAVAPGLPGAFPDAR